MSNRDTPDGPIGTRLLFEDENCRVWLLSVEPYRATSWHTHSNEYVYIVTSAGPVRIDYVEGSEKFQNEGKGTVVRRNADGGHRLVNLGPIEYRNIIVEIK